jgi:outer membrane protein, multidrug efflux system
MKWPHRLGIALAVGLTGCSAPPKTPYVKPALDLPAAWRTEASWREGQPNDGQDRGPWWSRFKDPQLDLLIDQALKANPSLALATARLAQSRSSVDAANAGLFPQVAMNTRAARQRISANRPLTNYNAPNFSTVQNDYLMNFSVAYEADLFGRVSSTVEAAKASAEQSVADFENVRLLLTSDLAANYFNLRQLDIELDVVDRAIALQRKALDLARTRYELGASSGLDVAQQQALLDTTLTQVDILRRQRSQFEHALASLVAVPAPQFSLAPEIRERVTPVIPLGLPSDLLERRPDIAAAERAMAAANAQIGIARAAYFPSVIIGPQLGVDSRSFPALFDLPSAVWSLGVNLAQPLFDGGRIDANHAFVKAGYEATTANYRRVVLSAMQEVEDGIIGSSALERAHAQALMANKSAEKVLRLATDRYEGGVSTFLEVISAQQALLNAQRQAAQLLGQRLLLSVFLVKALGGDWQGIKLAEKAPS